MSIVQLSRTVKTQQNLLNQEHERIGSPLDHKSVTTLLRDVDLLLSKDLTWVLRDHNGPSGEKQFISNMKVSAWLPATLKMKNTVLFDEKGIPFVNDHDGKQHYCLDLLQKWFRPTSNQAVDLSKAPLPGQAPNQAAKQPALPGPAAASPPLAGMEASPGNSVRFSTF